MILITGAAGYIGSHTALKFLEEGREVVVFDNLETGHAETIETLKKEGSLTFIKGDLKNREDINAVFENYNISSVLHFAAYAIVEESVKNPLKYYNNNVIGTLNLVNAMIEHNVKKIVFSSTCATYGEPQYLPIDENHPQFPVNPYGQTKLTVEKILKDYDKAYNLKSVILRYFNVAGCDNKIRIGEWHNPETHLVPNILKSALNTDYEFNIYGNDYDTPDGTCIRDYVNVNDLAKAHLLAYKYLEQKNSSEIFNLGTEHGSSVKEIFDICQKVLNKEIPVKFRERRTGDPAKLFANSAKAKRILGWETEHSVEDSVKTAYEWEKRLK
ncbi:UDP-glucose 4-epimerase GalE [bacterium]|nr:UDP-glucose 4-epimerase GalE [bacterium]